MSGLDLNTYAKNKHRTNKGAGGGLQELLSREIHLFEKKFGAREKEGFYAELGLLLSTGVDIKTAFEIIESDINDKKHRALIEGIKTAVIGGRRLYEALEAHPTVFSRYEAQSVKIGEETGQLAQVLKELAAFYESGIKLRRQITGVLTYPTVVIGIAIVIVYFMLSFVVPIFSDIFTQTGGQLPAITQTLITVSGYSDVLFYALFALIATLVGLHKWQKQKIWYRRFTSGLVLKLPVVNKLVQKIYLARFCQSMKLLAGSKVMVHEALDLIRNMIEFYPMEQALEQVKTEVVEKGSLLNESLGKHPIFPKKLVALIKLSEEVNAPEVIFDKLYKQYSAEIEHQQAVVGKLIEPLFIVVLGVFVGFILIAMYLPMFEMSSGTF